MTADVIPMMPCRIKRVVAEHLKTNGVVGLVSVRSEVEEARRHLGRQCVFSDDELITLVERCVVDYAPMVVFDAHHPQQAA